MSPTRREFLQLACAGAATAAVAATGGCSSPNCPATPTRPWTPTNRLRIPAQLKPAAGDVKQFDLRLQTGSTKFLPGKPVPTWGVNGSYLGPTLRMRTGDNVRMNVQNALPEETTVHWHGMRLPARMDGGPHQPIPTGHPWEPSWRVINDASTLWYHPHPHGTTALHVFRGVAGLIIVDDPVSENAPLPHDYGVDDIPCILQDRSIDTDGQVHFDTEPNFGQMGTDMLVNGTMNAYLPVATTKVRLRLLNASNARLYHLGLSDGRSFHLIANDSGLLPKPVELAQLSLGPAERAEIIISLSPSEKVTLRTVAGDERIDAGTFSILELRAHTDLTASPALPETLGGAGPVDVPNDARVRHFKLQGHDAINGNQMDMARIDEVVTANTVEIWEIENNVYSHNFHIHGSDFTILDKSGRPPAPYETGRKDTVHVREKSTVRVAVQFAGYTDPTQPYMYHCHILRHEDAGMMGQFVVVEPGNENSTPRHPSSSQESPR